MSSGFPGRGGWPPKAGSMAGGGRAAGAVCARWAAQQPQTAIKEVFGVSGVERSCGVAYNGAQPKPYQPATHSGGSTVTEPGSQSCSASRRLGLSRVRQGLWSQPAPTSKSFSKRKPPNTSSDQGHSKTPLFTNLKTEPHMGKSAPNWARPEF